MAKFIFQTEVRTMSKHHKWNRVQPFEEQCNEREDDNKKKVLKVLKVSTVVHA